MEKGNSKENFRIFQKITIKILHVGICDWMELHSQKTQRWNACGGLLAYLQRTNNFVVQEKEEINQFFLFYEARINTNFQQKFPRKSYKSISLMIINA